MLCPPCKNTRQRKLETPNPERTTTVMPTPHTFDDFVSGYPFDVCIRDERELGRRRAGIQPAQHRRRRCRSELWQRKKKPAAHSMIHAGPCLSSPYQVGVDFLLICVVLVSVLPLVRADRPRFLRTIGCTWGAPGILVLKKIQL